MGYDHVNWRNQGRGRVGKVETSLPPLASIFALPLPFPRFTPTLQIRTKASSTLLWRNLKTQVFLFISSIPHKSVTKTELFENALQTGGI